MSEAKFPYIHGFSQTEQDRLRAQAEFAEHMVYQDVDFSKCKNVLEVGCGVGAQSDILLRRFPKIQLTGIELNDAQLKACQSFLKSIPQYEGRVDILKMDATKMSFNDNQFDGAFLCWVLEHIPEPLEVLRELKRVLKPGSTLYLTEVMNSSFFLDPYSPNLWKYWMAFNDYQYDHGGDPFVGVKLGNLLNKAGFKEVQTNMKSWHLDNRNPERRKEVIEHWKELLLSASNQLVDAKYTDAETVHLTIEEINNVLENDDAVFFDSFMQAKAIV